MLVHLNDPWIGLQSQPCHWRNAKSVTKRSAPEEAKEIASTPVPLSQNINLFQSLRVLQEGEGAEPSALVNSKLSQYTLNVSMTKSK